MMFVFLHWTTHSISKTLLLLHCHWELLTIAPPELSAQFQDMEDTIWFSEYFLYSAKFSKYLQLTPLKNAKLTNDTFSTQHVAGKIKGNL
jgi:hypothetical protein